MKFLLDIDPYNLYIEAENKTVLGSDVILTGSKINVDIPFTADKFFSHGWQSWSLTAWLDVGKQTAPSFPSSLRSMQVDLPYALEKKPNGSWLGAINTPDGRIIFLGALSLESHVVFDGTSLSGTYEEGIGDWFLAIGPEQYVFNKYAILLGDKFGKTRLKESPKIWCSWYSLYKEIDENILLNILGEMDDLQFNVFQIDDGWQKKIGDWEPNEKFPSGLQSLATSIKASGKKAGLWLAPLLVVPSSNTFQNHREWILRDNKDKFVEAGVNWSEKLYALDTTHPQVLEWITDLMQKVRKWGFDYVKLDFLYAGALPGQRYKNIPRETAYRLGLEAIRTALGSAYLLTCGAPILPSLGLCDAIRIGPDVSDAWNLNFESRIMDNYAVPGIQNGIRTSINRLWLKPIVHTDPDVTYFHSYKNSLTQEQKDLLKNLSLIAEFKATSDLPNWLTSNERQELQTFLNSKPDIQYIGGNKYLINGVICDYSECIKFPKPLNIYEKIIQFIVIIISKSPIILMTYDKYSRARRRRYLKSEH